MSEQITTTETEQLDFLSLIESTHTVVEVLKESIKIDKEKLETELMQNEEYAAKAEAFKKAKEEFKQAKQNAMQNPICIEIADEIDRKKSDLKIKKEILSDSLVQYNERTGIKSVTLSSGENLKIVKSAKLKKESKQRRR